MTCVKQCAGEYSLPCNLIRMVVMLLWTWIATGQIRTSVRLYALFMRVELNVCSSHSRQRDGLLRMWSDTSALLRQRASLVPRWHMRAAQGLPARVLGQHLSSCSRGWVWSALWQPPPPRATVLLAELQCREKFVFMVLVEECVGAEELELIQSVKTELDLFSCTTFLRNVFCWLTTFEVQHNRPSEWF